jgi:hypothetical protein
VKPFQFIPAVAGNPSVVESKRQVTVIMVCIRETVSVHSCRCRQSFPDSLLLRAVSQAASLRLLLSFTRVCLLIPKHQLPDLCFSSRMGLFRRIIPVACSFKALTCYSKIHLGIDHETNDPQFLSKLNRIRSRSVAASSTLRFRCPFGLFGLICRTSWLVPATAFPLRVKLSHFVSRSLL